VRKKISSKCLREKRLKINVPVKKNNWLQEELMWLSSLKNVLFFVATKKRSFNSMMKKKRVKKKEKKRCIACYEQ